MRHLFPSPRHSHRIHAVPVSPIPVQPQGCFSVLPYARQRSRSGRVRSQGQGESGQGQGTWDGIPWQLAVVELFFAKNVKLAHLHSIDVYHRPRHLQSWTAALYNLGSCSWLAMTAVPRRTQWQPRVRANRLLGPQLQPAGILRPSQPR